MNWLYLINSDINARIRNGGQKPPKSKLKRLFLFIELFIIRNGIRYIVFIEFVDISMLKIQNHYIT